MSVEPKSVPEPKSAPEPPAERPESDVGRRVHAFRRLRRMSLRALAERSDVSGSFLSQLERGRSSASISTLARIASALGITMAELFDTSAIGPTPLRAQDRPELPWVGGGRKTSLTREPLAGFGVYEAEFAPGGSTGDEQYSHPGWHEVVVVLTNQVTVLLDTERFVLGEGDSLDFDSRQPHRIVNETDAMSVVHWVLGPVQPGDKE
ncbi:helix-turn-helix domain-containing protein [Streptomyces sp. NPDC005970]|uniref:helix-turn-helix domain-containing protein n=1 Tax=Streptomyces sp. NPDC005970 TaxID=3156723 RepID=UPI0033E71645